MKKLPISYMDQLNGECWTFYKFAILKAHSVATSWLATHVEFYINENLRGVYGNADCNHYKMNYFSDILSMTRIAASEVTSNEIVSTIINEIDKEHYIVMYLNFDRFYGLEGVSLHEILIYGYDREKEFFYCPYLIDGSFKEVQIPFKIVAMAYNDAREYYMQDGWQLLAQRSYYFGITSIRIRNDYQNDNFVADLIDKLDHEVHGQRIIQTDLSERVLKERVCYTGNACFTGLSDCIKHAVRQGLISDTILWEMIRTLKMMYDYRILFLSSMDWFAETVNGQNDAGLMTIMTEYKLCADKIQRCYLMLCKYDQTGEICSLESTKSLLDTLQKKEFEILSEYRELIFKYYYPMNGVPMPPDD